MNTIPIVTPNKKPEFKNSFTDGRRESVPFHRQTKQRRALDNAIKKRNLLLSSIWAAALIAVYILGMTILLEIGAAQ